jgi:hypothetical protein
MGPSRGKHKPLANVQWMDRGLQCLFGMCPACRCLIGVHWVPDCLPAAHLVLIQRRENVDEVATRHPQTSSDSLVDVSWSPVSVWHVSSV